MAIFQGDAWRLVSARRSAPRGCTHDASGEEEADAAIVIGVHVTRLVIEGRQLACSGERRAFRKVSDIRRTAQHDGGWADGEERWGFDGGCGLGLLDGGVAARWSMLGCSMPGCCRVSASRLSALDINGLAASFPSGSGGCDC